MNSTINTNNAEKLNSFNNNEKSPENSNSDNFFFNCNDNEEKKLIDERNDINLVDGFQTKITNMKYLKKNKSCYLAKKKKFKKLVKQNVEAKLDQNINDCPLSYSIILKAINKRKLKLSCPLCTSMVLNMSDHLVKKHHITDRLKRKSLMNFVRKSYLKYENSSELSKSESSIEGLNQQLNRFDNLTDNKFQDNQSNIDCDNNNLSKDQIDNNSIYSTSNRKLTRCPICKDDKYFVNISDHLIKIHEIVSREKRKPILKKIKQNNLTYSISNEIITDSSASSSSQTVSSNRSKKTKMMNQRRDSFNSENLIKLKKNKLNNHLYNNQIDDNYNNTENNDNFQDRSSDIPPLKYFHSNLQQQAGSNENNNKMVFIDKIVAEDSLLEYPNLDTLNNQNLFNFISDQQINTELANSLLLQSNLDFINNLNENFDLKPSDQQRLATKRNSLVYLLEQQRKLSLNNSTVMTNLDTSVSSSSSSSPIIDLSFDQINEKNNDSLNYPSSSDSISFESNENNIIERESCAYENFDFNNKEQMWPKLLSIEKKLNDTIDSFNIFSDNVITQIKSFSNQIVNSYNEIKKLKSNFLQLELDETFNNHIYSNQADPLTPNSELNQSLSAQYQSSLSTSFDVISSNLNDGKINDSDRSILPIQQDQDYQSNFNSTLNQIDVNPQILSKQNVNQMNKLNNNIKLENEKCDIIDQNDDNSSSSSLIVQNDLKNVNDLEKYKNIQLNDHQQSLMKLTSYLENIQNFFNNNQLSNVIK